MTRAALPVARLRGVVRGAALLGSLLALGVGLLAAPAQAREVPVLRARVTDEAGVLGGRRAALEERLAAYERATGHQFAVLVLRSLQGEVLESYSVRVAEAWRLGDARRDDGLLMLVAVDDRAARIEVGYGLEGAVPDVIAGRVMREHMIPRFKEGDWAGGVEAGLEALMRAAQGEALGPAPAVDGLGERERWQPILFFAIVALSVLLRIPRVVRVPFAVLLGGFVGYALLKSLLWAAGLALGLGLLALILPTLRGGGRYHRRGWVGGGSSWGGSSGGFGGFSGGGGSFGGGGASGRW